MLAPHGRTDGRTDEHWHRTDGQTRTLCWHRTDGRTDGRTDEHYDGRTDRREHYVGTARTDYRTKQRLTVWGFCFLQLPPLFNVKEIVSIESKL